MFMKKRGGGGGRSPVYMCITTCTLRGCGGMLPQKIVDFRLSETGSGACDFVVNREFLIWKQL